MPDKATIDLIIQAATLIVLFWKVAIPIGKFMQWKEDHENSNKREFQGLHRRIDDLKDTKMAIALFLLLFP